MAVMTNALYRGPSGFSSFLTLAIGEGQGFSARTGSCFSRAIKIFEGVGKFDSVAKVVQHSLEVAMAADPEGSGQDISAGLKVVKTGRDVMSVGKGPGGLWRAAGDIRNIVDLSRAMRNGHAECVIDGKNGPMNRTRETVDHSNYTQHLSTMGQMRLALGSNIAGVVEDLGTAFGFGICRNIQIAGKISSTPLPEHVAHLGQQMGFVMFAKHIGSFIRNILDWFLERFTFQNVWAHKDENYLNLDEQGITADQITQRVRLRREFEKMHTQNRVRLALKQGEAVGELVADVALFTPTPPLYSVTAKLVASVFGLGAAWAGA